MNNQPIENTNSVNEISDLEPQRTEEIKGGQTREHILLAQPTGDTGVRGDANSDGKVDAADYVVWR